MLTYDEVKAKLNELFKVDNRNNWEKGEVIVAGELSEDGLRELHRELAIEKGTLEAFRDVSQAFPEDKRNPQVSWSVHQVAFEKFRNDPETRWRLIADFRPLGTRNEMRALCKLTKEQMNPTENDEPTIPRRPKNFNLSDEYDGQGTVLIDANSTITVGIPEAIKQKVGVGEGDGPIYHYSEPVLGRYRGEYTMTFLPIASNGNGKARAAEV